MKVVQTLLLISWVFGGSFAASAGFSNTGIHLAATNGFSGGYRRSSHWLSAVAITGEGTGMERDYFGESRIYRGDLPSPEEVGALDATVLAPFPQLLESGRIRVHLLQLDIEVRVPAEVRLAACYGSGPVGQPEIPGEGLDDGDVLL